MRRVRTILQVLVAAVLVGGFALCLLAALTDPPKRRAGAIFLRVP